MTAPDYTAIVRRIPALAGRHRIHLAIMREPWLSRVLDGSKTIESRFSRDRRAPWSAVDPGDAIVWKASGGPVVAWSEVTAADFRSLPDTDAWADLIPLCPAIGIDAAYLVTKRYGGADRVSLITVGPAVPVEPFPIVKRDQRAWIVLERPSLFAEVNP